MSIRCIRAVDQSWVNPWGKSANPTNFNQSSYGYNGWMYAGSWPDDFVPGMPQAQKAAYSSETDIVQSGADSRDLRCHLV